MAVTFIYLKYQEFLVIINKFPLATVTKSSEIKHTNLVESITAWIEIRIAREWEYAKQN